MTVVVLPKTLTAHTDALASDLMANFNAILGVLNGNVDDTNLASSVTEAKFVSGDLKPTARSAPPTGWLLCDGAAVSRSTYAALFAAIGTFYGAGNGSTTFNVPDMRGRAPFGVDAGAGRITTNNGRGQSGGHQALAAHQHDQGSLSTSVENVNHVHNVHIQAANQNLGGPSVQSVMIPSAGAIATDTVSAFHTHAISGVTGSTGSGPNDGLRLPPYTIVNWLVKI